MKRNNHAFLMDLWLKLTSANSIATSIVIQFMIAHLLLLQISNIEEILTLKMRHRTNLEHPALWGLIKLYTNRRGMRNLSFKWRESLVRVPSQHLVFLRGKYRFQNLIFQNLRWIIRARCLSRSLKILIRMLNLIILIK